MYNKNPIKLAIFASGAGSNTKKIVAYFRTSARVKIALVVCNNPVAGVLKIAQDENIPTLLLDRKIFNDTGYITEFKNYGIDFIVLAGFLWKIPGLLISAFKGKIINIHPALLPAHGGKGLYGNAVHAAVIAAKEKESGITIHYVDEIYDHGKIIFQATCSVSENESVGSLAEKIHELEHKHYANQIEKLISGE